jgi:hypothetical protein
VHASARVVCVFLGGACARVGALQPHDLCRHGYSGKSGRRGGELLLETSICAPRTKDSILCDIHSGEDIFVCLVSTLASAFRFKFLLL